MFLQTILSIIFLNRIDFSGRSKWVESDELKHMNLPSTNYHYTNLFPETSMITFNKIKEQKKSH